MTRGEIFEVWAPAGALWSAWAKPVLFAHLGPRPVLPQSPEIHIDWAHRADGASAVVVDLPGASGVAVGLHLAQLGYRPVPLYNACPSPDTAAGPGQTIVDVEPIMAELFGGTERLSRLTLPPTAPPAFLLDDRRRYGNTITPAPGVFDNRSVSLPTDFPSASRLLAHGIRRVVLVQERSTYPQEDLSHTLVRWQEAGIEVLAVNLSAPGPPRSIVVQKPTMYRRIWQRVLATMGLRRNPLGGFGGLLPVPSTG
ncbi:MAG TPA: hypothetical protein VFO67_05305 [Gemmatimonadales bacterium]|nr:hypothetical protein [Gemmatimonadales bacterium]